VPLWGSSHLGAWEPLAFNINMSLNLLFMIIIGGMGSLLGAYFGAAFIVLLPILLNQIPGMFGVHCRCRAVVAPGTDHLRQPDRLLPDCRTARLAGCGRSAKEKMRLWPFPH